MNLKKIGPNQFKDEEHGTTFQFSFNHELSLSEAERRAYALIREQTEILLKKHFYGKYHFVPETGKVDPSSCE